MVNTLTAKHVHKTTYTTGSKELIDFNNTKNQASTIKHTRSKLIQLGLKKPLSIIPNGYINLQDQTFTYVPALLETRQCNGQALGYNSSQSATKSRYAKLKGPVMGYSLR